ncbi:MAG: hypothetical protein WCE44_02590 [Candidatus Velthaea sp.]
MRNGISAGPLPQIWLPFAAEISQACVDATFGAVRTFSPLVAYAVKVNETGSSTDPAEIQGGADPNTLLMPDGSNAGRGIFQLTSSWPPNWQKPYANALYALENPGFLMEAEQYWVQQGYVGEALVKLIAASFNAGIGGAQVGHDQGNCDLNTTDNYGARAVAHYQALFAGRSPFS